MLSAVNLDDEPSIGTEEVADKSIDWHLSLEFPSVKPAITQAKPQHALGISLITPQSSGELHWPLHHRILTKVTRLTRLRLVGKNRIYR
jgi:hypothetical protein